MDRIMMYTLFSDAALAEIKSVFKHDDVSGQLGNNNYRIPEFVCLSSTCPFCVVQLVFGSICYPRSIERWFPKG